MNPTNRNRALWLLVALVSVHVLVTTAIFLATGTLPNALLVFTLVVFGVCTLAAVYFMASPPHRGVHRIEAEQKRVVVEDRAAEEEPIVRLQVDSVGRPLAMNPVAPGEERPDAL